MAAKIMMIEGTVEFFLCLARNFLGSGVTARGTTVLTALGALASNAWPSCIRSLANSVALACRFAGSGCVALLTIASKRGSQ